MNKKAIAILAIIFLLIVGMLGFLVYSKYSGGGTTETNNENPEGGTTETTDNGNGDGTEVENGENAEGGGEVTPLTEKFVRLSSDQVVSPVLFYNGNGITYLNKSGEFYKSEFETLANGQLQFARSKQLTIPVKSGINRILWPKTGDDFIAEILDAAGNRFYSYYNFFLGAYVDLPSQVKAVEWLPTGDKILFVWVDADAQGNEHTTLNIANPDTSSYNQIAELWEADDAIYLSPDGSNIIFHKTTSSDGVNKLILTTPDGKVWKDLVGQGYNYGILWSPDSQKFLFAKRERTGGLRFQLWYYDLYSGQIVNLGFYTLPVKTVWSQDSRAVYAAVPKEDKGIINPEDLDNTFTIDSFYKIDVETLEKVEYQSQNLVLDGRDLFLSPSEDKLFFKNAQDGGLYYLDLTK